MGGSSLENRRMLKEFLVDEELPCCSSNTEFFIKKSYWNPRKPCKLRSSSSAAAAAGRNRSKAASISISAVHKASDMVINAIKFFPFIKTTPAINNYLPRSISRKLLSSSCSNSSRTNQVLDHPSVYKVKIKDILRWKSFRDITMEMEEIIPLPSSSSMEFSCLPNQTIITMESSSKFKDSTSSGSTMSSSWSGTDDEDLSQDKDCLNEDGPEFSKHSNLPQFPDQGTIVSKVR